MDEAVAVTPGPTRDKLPTGQTTHRKNTQKSKSPLTDLQMEKIMFFESPRCHLKLLLCFKKNFLITLIYQMIYLAFIDLAHLFHIHDLRINGHNIMALESIMFKTGFIVAKTFV